MIDFQNELDMFQSALCIEKPWFVSYRKFEKEIGELHIYLNFVRGATFQCPSCHSNGHTAYDTNGDRAWRHLDFFQYKTILHARLPRVDCKKCGKITTVNVEWSKPSGHFTWLFESFVMSLMKEMPVAAVARQVKEHDTRLWRIFHYYVNKAMKIMDFSQVQQIAVDETSSLRGHQYITLFVDMDTKRVMFATEGKGSDVISTLLNFLEEKQINTNQIKEFCCDMSPAFISGIEKYFPNACITFDKFHVMKMINEAVNDVRIEEQKENPVLKKTKYLWLKNEKNLKANQKEHLAKLKDMNIKTGKAYRLKLAFQDFWCTPAIYADIYLKEWYQWAVRTRINSMIQVAKTIKKHEDGILRWFQSKLTNGFLEGLNGLVQAAKRKARGYRNIKNLIAMVYVTGNKLEINVKPN